MPSCHPDFWILLHAAGASQVAQCWKAHLTVQKTQETQVWSLGWEDPLEEEMATHSGILAWKISWTEDPGGLQPTGSQRVRQDWAAHTHTHTHTHTHVIDILLAICHSQLLCQLACFSLRISVPILAHCPSALCQHRLKTNKQKHTQDLLCVRQIATGLGKWKGLTSQMRTI